MGTGKEMGGGGGGDGLLREGTERIKAFPNATMPS